MSKEKILRELELDIEQIVDGLKVTKLYGLYELSKSARARVRKLKSKL